MSPQIIAYVPQITLDEVLPFAILLLAGLAVLTLDALLDVAVKGITRQRRDSLLGVVTGAALLITGATFYGGVIDTSGRTFLDGMLRSSEFANMGSLVICFGALMFTIMAPRLIEARRLPAGEFYALLLFSVFGMTMLTVANDLIVAFICIEILSLALYAMVGIDRRSRAGAEASFKYFMLGAFASAFLVLGIAFLFGATGTTQLVGSNARVMDDMMYAERRGTGATLPVLDQSYNLGIREVLFAEQRLAHVARPTAEIQGASVVVTKTPLTIVEPLNPVWVFLGFGLLLVGMCFKLSLAPFHMWAPDVYEGAPTIVAMLVATTSKVAGFAFFITMIEIMSFWPHFPKASAWLLSAIAVTSMVWGNLGALVQTNIKRMLAYSSIAHGGYMMVAAETLVTPDVFSDALRSDMVRNAIIFYLFAYTVINTVTFGIVAYMGRAGEGDIASYRGFAQRHPGLAFGMALALISLMGLGIPATVGFWGKYYIFKEAMQAQQYTVAIIGMITSAISAYYYLQVIVAMYMKEEDPSLPIAGAGVARANGYTLVIGLTTAMIFLFGILPPLFFALARLN